MATFEEVFGKVLAKERDRVKLTQEALAYRCDLHPTYISQLERGINSPTVRVLRTLAQELGTTASEILRRAEEAATAGTLD